MLPGPNQSGEVFDQNKTTSSWNGLSVLQKSGTMLLRVMLPYYVHVALTYAN